MKSVKFLDELSKATDALELPSSPIPLRLEDDVHQATRVVLQVALQLFKPFEGQIDDSELGKVYVHFPPLLFEILTFFFLFIYFSFFRKPTIDSS